MENGELKYADTVTFYFGWYVSMLSRDGKAFSAKYINDSGRFIGPVMKDELVSGQQYSLTESQFNTLPLAACEDKWPYIAPQSLT